MLQTTKGTKQEAMGKVAPPLGNVWKSLLSFEFNSFTPRARKKASFLRDPHTRVAGSSFLFALEVFSESCDLCPWRATFDVIGFP